MLTTMDYIFMNPIILLGGKFGVQKDRMDKCAVGHDYVGKVEKHESQTDHKKVN